MFEKLKEGAAGVAAEKAQDVIREFNDTLPTLKALGLSVSNVSVKMGVPPEVGARLTGSVAALDQAKIKALIQGQPDKKVINAILEALRTAANFKEQLGQVGFSGITVDVTLGLLPNVEVGLLTGS